MIYCTIKLEGKILETGNSSFPMNYLNIWYCVGAAALAIAGSYIIWGPSNRPKRRKSGYVPGLVNLGNSCFLNAVLQALASCPSSISWLQKITLSASESVLNENYLLIKALSSILKSLNGEEEICSGEHVIEALRTHRWIISNEEQDAHELFHVLTSTIEEELKSANPLLSLLDAGKLEDGGDGDNSNPKVPSKSFISSTKTDHSRLASPVCGLLVSELKCNMCNSKYPARYDNFDSISLAIPSPHWAHLQDLLMKFISCELVQDVTCDFCIKQSSDTESECAVIKSVFTKQLSFGKLPKCLCIHIQRTVWLKNGVSVKNYDYVAFPEVLIMDYFVHRHIKKNVGIDANYMQLRLTGGNAVKTDTPVNSSCTDPVSDDNAPTTENTSDSANTLPEQNSAKAYKYTYMLKAVIVHLGDTSSGHFITYRRGSMNSQYESKWYYISDAEVKEVSFTEVSRSCAYMLFYESLTDQSAQKF